MERRKRVIFQTVILQRVSGLSGARIIRDRIESQINLWNKGAYNELVKDSHRVAEEYLGNKRGTQTQDQWNCTFSNLVLKKGNCAKPFVLFGNGIQGWAVT